MLGKCIVVGCFGLAHIAILLYFYCKVQLCEELMPEDSTENNEYDEE